MATSFVNAWPAFDCRSSHVVGVYNLAEPDCEANLQQSHAGKFIREVNVTLVQIPKYLELEAIVFTASRRQVSYYCSYTYLTSPLHYKGWADDFSNYKIPTDDARRALKTMRYQLQHTVAELSTDKDTIVADTNQFDSNGYCITSRKNLKFYEVKVSVSKTKVRIILDTKGNITRTTCFDEDVLRNLDSNDGYLHDGSFVQWESSPDSGCPWELVHTGAMQVYDRGTNKTAGIFDELGIGLMLSDKTELCNLTVETTTDKYLYVLQGKHPIKNSLNPTQYASWSSLVQSAVRYLEVKHVNMFNGLSSTIILNQCLLEEDLRREIILREPGDDPERVGYRLTGKKGMVVTVSGALVTLLKCNPIEVSLRTVDHCTVDVPVRMVSSNQSLFMDPFSFVLKNTSSKLDCQDPHNPYFVIRGRHYRLTPTLQPMPEPEILPTDLRSLTFHDINEMSGLYPQEIVKQSEVTWTYVQRRRDAVNHLINIANPQIGHLYGRSNLADLFYEYQTSFATHKYWLILPFFNSLVLLVLIIVCLCRKTMSASKQPVNVNVNQEVQPT